MSSKDMVDELKQLILSKADALAEEDPQRRIFKARDVLVGVLGLCAEFLGPELLATAYGKVDPSAEREELLHLLATRLHITSTLFWSLPNDSISLSAVTSEALAVARGDAPLLFARLEGRKVNYRVLRAKFEALKWDKFLDGMGLGPPDRHARIASAFGQEWETIRRRWKKDVIAGLTKVDVPYFLQSAKLEGKTGFRPSSLINPGETWETALARSGRAFLQAQTDNAGNI